MSIELIRARQQELAAAEELTKKKDQERKERAKQIFADTGIPAMWAAIKDIKVPHWRTNNSRNCEHDAQLIALSEHAAVVSDTALKLFNWDGLLGVGWYVEITDKGATWLRISGPRGERKDESYTPDALRDHFVDYMAKFLPPLETNNA
jgi:hypothetical protein